LIPSEALAIASPSQSDACRPNAAASLNRIIICSAWSRENPFAMRFLSEVAASSVVTSPSAVKFCMTFFAFSKSPPVPWTIDLSPVRALLRSLASCIVWFIPAVIPANATHPATAIFPNVSWFLLKELLIFSVADTILFCASSACIGKRQMAPPIFLMVAVASSIALMTMSMFCPLDIKRGGYLSFCDCLALSASFSFALSSSEYIRI